MRYFEDYRVGDTYDLGSISVTAEEIIAFARQFDPQYFHMDPERATNSIFGGLVASGWHTTSLFMRLLVDGLLNESASIASPGVDEVRWFKPVRPGDVLHGRFTVLSSKTSQSRPDMGVITSRGELLNQNDEVVLHIVGIHFLGRNPVNVEVKEDS
jgi:acyl dehydratase